MPQPRYNLLPWCKYRKKGGKCKGVDTNPTHDRCCQDLEVLVLLLLTSSRHSRLQPLLVAQPREPNLVQPSAARADSHRPRHQTTRGERWKASTTGLWVEIIVSNNADYQQRFTDKATTTNVKMQVPGGHENNDHHGGGDDDDEDDEDEKDCEKDEEDGHKDDKESKQYVPSLFRQITLTTKSMRCT